AIENKLRRQSTRNEERPSAGIQGQLATRRENGGAVLEMDRLSLNADLGAQGQLCSHHSVGAAQLGQNLRDAIRSKSDQTGRLKQERRQLGIWCSPTAGVIADCVVSRHKINAAIQ